MTTTDLLMDAYERIQTQVHAVLKGLDRAQLAYRPGAEANSIAWLVWHLARVQDDHIAELAGTPQCYVADGWAKKFDLPFDDTETGWGHTSDQVAQVKADAATLRGYYDAVHAATCAYLKTLGPKDYDQIIDRSWDPPVTRGVRLVSVLSDDLQHVGQAAYVRGLLP